LTEAIGVHALAHFFSLYLEVAELYHVRVYTIDVKNVQKK